MVERAFTRFLPPGGWFLSLDSKVAFLAKGATLCQGTSHLTPPPARRHPVGKPPNEIVTISNRAQR